MKTSLSLLTITLTLLANYASAALYDRGNGLIYDDTLDITWLQDANYAETSGYDANGLMTWQEAMSWADGLTYAEATEWELPKQNNSGLGSGQTDSHMGHMYYNNLNNFSLSLLNTEFNDPTTGNIVQLDNIQSNYYWTQDLRAENQNPWVFGMHNGNQGSLPLSKNKYAWAVHDGDVANNSDLNAVPVPASAFFFGSALLCLMFKRRQANP